MNASVTVKFKFEEPINLELELPGYDEPIKVDLYKAYQCIFEADKKPNEEQKWKHIEDFINEQCDISPEENVKVWEGTLREFRNLAIRVMEEHQANIKKKFAQTALLPTTILD